MKYTSQPYHYFIAGLPDLNLNTKSLPFSRKYLFEYLRNHIDPQDLQQLQLLLAPSDHHNLLHLMFGRPTYFINDGNYSQTQLLQSLEQPEILPQHMQDFLKAYHEAESIYGTDKSWENRLTEIYIDFMIRESHPVLSKWLEFERNFKNITLAINCHKYGIPYQDFLIGKDQITQLLIQEDPPRLESLRGEISYLNALYGLFSIQDLVEREHALTHIKWRYMEEISFFESFGIGYLIAYTLQFLMVERWSQLRPESGEQTLNKMLNTFHDAAVKF